MTYRNEYHFFFNYIAESFFNGNKVEALKKLALTPETEKQQALKELKKRYTIIPCEGGVFIPELA